MVFLIANRIEEGRNTLDKRSNNYDLEIVELSEAPVSAPNKAHNPPSNPVTAASRNGLSPPKRLPIRPDRIESFPASIYIAVPNHTKKTARKVINAVLPRPSLKIIASAKPITATNHHCGKNTPERKVRTASRSIYISVFIILSYTITNLRLRKYQVTKN